MPSIQLENSCTEMEKQKLLYYFKSHSLNSVIVLNLFMSYIQTYLQRLLAFRLSVVEWLLLLRSIQTYLMKLFAFQLSLVEWQLLLRRLLLLVVYILNSSILYIILKIILYIVRYMDQVRILIYWILPVWRLRKFQWYYFEV